MTDQKPLTRPLVVTPEEAAELLRVSRTKIYALIQTGELRSIRIRKSRRIPFAALETFIETLSDTETSEHST